MKLQSVAQGMVLAAVVLFAAHAFAAPVNLLCGATAGLTFDEDRGTASFSAAPASVASFTATTIKWSTPADPSIGASGTDYYLDRISGILRVSFFCLHCMDPKLRQTYSETCVVAEKKF
jgi:hypothetical protein